MGFLAISTPIGTLTMESRDGALRKLTFSELGGKVKEDEITTETSRQLEEYFEGKRTEFDIPVQPDGTEFQKRVWNMLLDIPFGKLTSYGRLAALLGDPKSVRAVGTANGANPIAIIIPCHRVIGTNGDLVGYAGGLDNKSWLLKHEGMHGLDQLKLF